MRSTVSSPSFSKPVLAMQSRKHAIFCRTAVLFDGVRYGGGNGSCWRRGGGVAVYMRRVLR